MFLKRFPIPIGIRDRIKQWTFGLYSAGIKYLMSAFDVLEVRKPFIVPHIDVLSINT